MIFRYLLCAQSQFAIPSGKEHLHGSVSAILARLEPLLLPRLKIVLKQCLQDVAEIQMNTTRRKKTSLSLRLRSGRMAEIAAFNAKDRTLKEITQSTVHVH